MTLITIDAADVTAITIDIITKIPTFKKIRLINVQGNRFGPLNVVTINEMKKLQAEDCDKGGEPKSYAIDAGKLYMYPFPGENAIVEVYFYAKQPLLKEGVVESNVFSLQYPDALLHAACLEAVPYMDEDERIPVWENKYLVAISTANEESDKIKLGSTPLKRIVRVA